MVMLIKKSTQKAGAVEAMQVHLKLKVLKVVQDVVTRWNSKHDMGAVRYHTTSHTHHMHHTHAHTHTHTHTRTWVLTRRCCAHLRDVLCSA